MGHAVFGESGRYALCQISFAVDVEDGADVGDLVGKEGEGVFDVEDGADVGDLVGKEGEGVFLLLVDGIEGVTLNALAVGGIVDAQRAGLAAIDTIPSDREHARVAVGSRGVIGVVKVEGVRPGMRVSGREHHITAPPESDKEFVEDGSALLPLPGADRG